jgi:hypothetical protein
MANRFPLIVNTTSGNSVQELPSGDFLDLSNSGIANSGNITVSGIVSATGNVSGNYILGNGSQLSGIITSVSSLSNGTSNVDATSSGGNVTVGVGGTSNVAVFATTGVFITGVVSASGNVTGGNINTAGVVSATGNVSGGNLNVTGNIVDTGPMSLVTAASGNVNLAPNGTNVLIATTTGANITGTLNATGNANVGNLGAATVVATTVTGGNISIAADLISSLGTTLTIDPATAGNAGLVVINGNLQVNGTTTTINSNVVSTNDLTVNYANNAVNSAAANGGGIEVGPIGTPFITWLYNSTANVFTSSGGVSAVGNITGGNLSGTSIVGTLSTAAQTNITSVGTLTALAVTGNITSGNLSGTSIVGTLTTAAQTNITSVGTLGSLAVTGNISGGNINATLNGSGANVTSISATNISSGTLAQARLANASLTVNGTSIALGGSGTVTATATNALTIGTGLGGTSYNGSTGVTITNTGVTSLVAGTNIAVSGATGAVTVSVTGTVPTATSATTAGTVTTAAQGNITSVGTLTALAVSGAITVNSGAAATAIVNGATTGVGNIGSSTTTFNTVFAKATTAQYADLAENYVADQDYPVGTVLCIGGDKEVTSSNAFHSTKIIGTVSDNPAYLMNSGLQGENVVAVAFTGRVPCRVVGKINRGDLLVTSHLEGVATVLNSAFYLPGCVLGKALEEYNSDIPGMIEIVIGRF